MYEDSFLMKLIYDEVIIVYPLVYSIDDLASSFDRDVNPQWFINEIIHAIFFWDDPRA